MIYIYFIELCIAMNHLDQFSHAHPVKYLLRKEIIDFSPT